MQFAYEASTVVEGLSPSRGPLVGGTHVTISGSGFVDGGEYVCAFGAARVPASFITSSRMGCISPRQYLSTVSFGLALLGQRMDIFTHENLRFAFVSDIVLSTVMPPFFSAQHRSILRLTGGSFLSTSICRFTHGLASVSVSSSFVSSSTMSCVSPAINIGSVLLEVVDSRDGLVSSNGIHMNVVAPTTIRKLYPTSGDVRGGNLLSIFGDNFNARLFPVCLFAFVQKPLDVLLTNHNS
jgi:hypothetical protein